MVVCDLVLTDLTRMNCWWGTGTTNIIPSGAGLDGGVLGYYLQGWLASSNGMIASAHPLLVTRPHHTPRRFNSGGPSGTGRREDVSWGARSPSGTLDASIISPLTGLPAQTREACICIGSMVAAADPVKSPTRSNITVPAWVDEVSTKAREKSPGGRSQTATASSTCCSCRIWSRQGHPRTARLGLHRSHTRGSEGIMNVGTPRAALHDEGQY
ncbi:hypothetical protein EV126DRAFT_172959 [Verticillium dahliae]|nr:hypothetical protein EV126DRAFT_172959 [Verticillium dahliae]